MGLFIWSAVLFVLPMFISSPSYIIKTYHDWYPDLLAKNATNVVSDRGNRSVMGMISKIFHVSHLSNLVVLAPAMLLMALPYLRMQYWRDTRYQLLLLASVLIFTVIYSTGSEPPTYIIAFIGVAIWFMALPRPVAGFDWFLLFFALLITSFSNSDVIPKYVRVNYILPYALIALPCLLIWFRIIYDMLMKRFEQYPLESRLPS